MRDISCGLDFGTTNSAIGILTPESRVEIVPVNDVGVKMIPSIMYFPNDEKGIYVGEEAISEYLAWRDGRFIQSVKTVLSSRSFTNTRIRNEEYDVSDLVAIILEHMKLLVDRYTGRDVRSVVLGRPVEFSLDSRMDHLAEDRLRKSAKLVGFDEVRFQLEPVAAAFAYETRLRESHLTLIADFGGGTSDFTLIELGPDRVAKADRKSDIIATAGLPVAGDVFDAKVMSAKIRGLFGDRSTYEGFWPGKRLPIPNTIMSDLCNKGRIMTLYNDGMKKQLEMMLETTDDHDGIDRLLRLINHNLGFAIFSAVEKGKKDLSVSESVRIFFDEWGISVDIVISRSEFEEMISGEVARISGCIEELLHAGQVPVSRVDSVYLTGGSSLVPMVRRLLVEKFGEHKLVFSEETFLSVVTGLTLSAKYLFA